ncbi:MAG TPA: transposase [Candidatus Acidoferrales bacterium]|nr:transposase [Candidatus Acidoferrales bacterium]
MFVADDPTLTGHAGLAISGELLRKLRLVEVVGAELAAEDRVASIKQRRRGISAGALPVSIAECQMVGGECFDDMQRVRDDTAGALLRAVADVPSAPTARQLARKFRPAHIRAIERAVARCGNDLDRRLGRDPSEAVTFDLDALESVVYGHQKCGTGRSRCGHLAYNSFIVTWAQRGRGLTSELKGGNQARITASSSLAMLSCAQRLLPKEHGQIAVRADIGFYSAELMIGCRKRGMRCTLSAPRTPTMWRAVGDVPTDGWQDAIDMRGAQVAELPFTPQGWKHERLRLVIRRVPVTAAELAATSAKARRRTTIPPEQLQIVLDGQLQSTYAYSFIVTDIPNSDTVADSDTAADSDTVMGSATAAGSDTAADGDTVMGSATAADSDMAAIGSTTAKSEMSSIEVEYFHRHRAQIEERFKDVKLGQALRHLPSGNLNANRLWLCSCVLALNITAWVCDISPAAGASGISLDEEPPDEEPRARRRVKPRRRHAKTLRRLFFCVPGRIARSARQVTVHLPEGYRHIDLFNATYAVALTLPGP